VKEAFSYGYEWTDRNKRDFDNSLQGHNVWPEPAGSTQGSFHSEEFREEMNKLFDGMRLSSERISCAMSLAMGNDQSYLTDMCRGGETISLMRLFHYFPLPPSKAAEKERANTKTIGSSPHTDWGFLTLILQDDARPGLQVYDYSQGVYIDVPPVADTLVVNTGDYVSLLTKDKFISPLHRVVHPQETSRLSFVFFYYPNYYSSIPVGDGSKTHSLLMDQGKVKQGSTTGVHAMPRSFGDFISKKWQSVQR
jgi:isopenicillin N synthase-like dioxygenase